MGSPTNVEENITQIPMKGVEEYRWFYETQLGEILQDYREGKLKKEEASEAIASVCTDRETYQLFHVVDVWKDGEPIDRRVFRSDSTMKKLLNEARRCSWALLYRGMFFIPEKVWREYKENYTTANRFEVFKLERLIQTASHILIDIDEDSFENLKRAVKYLHKLGIYPEVWESASGEGNYHVYIHLVGQVWKRTIKKEDGEKIEHRWVYLPYASDYRVKRSVEAFKEIFKRLGVKYDSISATRAVWMEGFPNPEKGGRSSKKIWEGRVHRIDKLYERLLPICEGMQKEKAVKQFLAEIQPRKKVEVRGTYEVVSEEHSNVIDYLQDNVSTAFRMIDRGYTRMEAEAELRAGWTGDEKQFERAFPKFWDWVEATYKPLEVKLQGGEAKPKEKRKHKHFWEYIDAIHKALKDGYRGVREIASHIGASPSTVSKIFKLVSREQILENPSEAKAYLKSIQKGGDRLSKEQKKALSEEGKKRFRRYMEKFLEETSKRPIKPKRDKEEEKECVYGERIAYESLQGVQIGSYSISLFEIRKGGDGIENNSTGTKSLDTYFFSPLRTSFCVFLNNEWTGDDWQAGNGDSETIEDIVRRKVEGISEDLVKKHLEGKDPKSKYDPQDPLEKARVKRALELIDKVEQRWDLELGELPQGNYRRLIFGAVRRRGRRTYDLGGWGRFAKVLGEVLEDLGYRVIYPRLKELQYELGEYEDGGPSLEELSRNEMDLSDLYDENGEIPF